ncbi:hypothetical protein SAMN05444166_1944 [Singulisphaera sp. GP187]|uniref:hypothetical protein n=1 Tax=Singulisphaera sp. GP187 TaxID=1882752 RepID=UPI0009296691|nr:hypothetical protein [Singulisphaera sp. GP187]SIN99233.1 hypothetical protein SAMN05444166_1944 [Singulisphaera sp. GP187]
MTRRKRNFTIGIVVSLLVAAEVGLQSLRLPAASVRVVNQGGEPIKNLRLVSGRSEATVATIPDGESANLVLEGRGKQTLVVSFQQKNNPLVNFEIPVFDPAALHRDGFSLVIVIRQNEFERYQDDGDPPRWSRLATGAWHWLEKSLESP